MREPRVTPEAFIQRCGAAPAQFTWSPWPALLVARGAVETLGMPRPDFCFMGEDLEYTLRLSWRNHAVLVPRATAWHLPPGVKTSTESYFIDCMHLQNLCYLAVWLPHGHRARRHLPGAIRRFLRRGRLGPAGLANILRALWRGIVRGRPAGAPGADGFWVAYQSSRRA